MARRRIDKYLEINSDTLLRKESYEHKVQAEISSENLPYIQALSKKRRIIMLDYQSLQDQILKTDNLIERENYVREALEVAKLLRLIYSSVPRDAERLSNEIAAYTSWLDRGKQGSQTSFSFSLSASIHENHSYLNSPRLIGVRVRRTLIATKGFFSAESDIFKQLKYFETSTRDFINYQAWIFFIPRLLSNIIFLCSHTIQNPWMSQIEENLGTDVRLYIELDKRWFELVNDLNWLISGLIGCYILVGNWAFFSPYLITITQFVDVINAAARIMYENSLREEWLEGYNQDDPHMTFLKQRIDAENNAFYLSLVNAIVLTIANILFCITSIYYLPLIGGVIAVTMTILNALYASQLRAPSPSQRLIEFLKKNPLPELSFKLPTDQPSPPLLGAKSTGHMDIFDEDCYDETHDEGIRFRKVVSLNNINN